MSDKELPDIWITWWRGAVESTHLTEKDCYDYHHNCVVNYDAVTRYVPASKLEAAEKEIEAMSTDYLSTLSELADRLRLLHSASLEADGPNNEDLKRAYQAVIDDLRRAEELKERITAPRKTPE